MSAARPIGVVGPGAIGGLFALRLAAAGEAVRVVGRSDTTARLARLQVTLPDGRALRAPAGLEAGDDPRRLADVGLCLVAVQSAATAAVAAELAAVLPPDAVVVSLQNGLRNVERLRDAAPGAAVAQGIVAFNVARPGADRLMQASEGPLYLEQLVGEPGARLAALREALAVTGLSVRVRADIERVAAAKLLINLNNGVGAATGLGIVDTLRDQDARRCFAACVREGHRVLKAAGLRPGHLYGVPASLLGGLLALPDWIVLPLARRLTRMDPAARSSTLQALERGRPTELDDLNGDIVRRARAAGVEAPANAVICAAVRAHERRVAAGLRPEFPTPATLYAALRARGPGAPTTDPRPEEPP